MKQLFILCLCFSLLACSQSTLEEWEGVVPSREGLVEASWGEFYSGTGEPVSILISKTFFGKAGENSKEYCLKMMKEYAKNYKPPTKIVNRGNVLFKRHGDLEQKIKKAAPIMLHYFDYHGGLEDKLVWEYVESKDGLIKTKTGEVVSSKKARVVMDEWFKTEEGTALISSLIRTVDEQLNFKKYEVNFDRISCTLITHNASLWKSTIRKWFE